MESFIYPMLLYENAQSIYMFRKTKHSSGNVESVNQSAESRPIAHIYERMFIMDVFDMNWKAVAEFLQKYPSSDFLE